MAQDVIFGCQNATMYEELMELERIARALEPEAEARLAVRNEVIAYGENFLNRIDQLKAYDNQPDKGIGLLDSPIGVEPLAIAGVLDLLHRNVDTPGLNPASAGHLGYIPGGGIYYSALGDYLADVTNRYAGVFFASPGAVRMENMLIAWMAKILGYPAECAGNLTSGGSMANLIAIITARDAKKINSSNLTRSVIYLTHQSHHSLQKAIRIAGLGECILRYVALDASYRMIPSELERLVHEDISGGLNPWLVIGSAGTTDVGAIDPLGDIAAIARRFNLWFHLDAAYGGFFMLTETGRIKLRGIEKSDSVCIDPHKGLFIPYGLGAVLIKDVAQMQTSLSYLANYMQDTLSSTDEPSPADMSPELSKHFRGLRLWLPLKLHGTRPFAACLDEKLLLTKYFTEEIRKIGFEVCCEPELTVVIYRYIPKTGNPDEFNRRLVEAVQKDGRIFISSTLLDAKFTLRFSILSFRTHLDTVRLAIQILKEKSELLEKFL
jgi:glutamate/tyrosine decarboxylase-like PLP-dependent enzyme